MKLEAPLTVELVALSDWRYYFGLDDWVIDIVEVQVGWPPTLVCKLFGLGFRFDMRWERT